MAPINLYESGSLWRRWNPHIHAPGTIINDQFKNKLDEYLKAIDDATPKVEVLGVTDYFCLEAYKTVKAAKEAGALKGVKLLFPNIEFRMTLETAKQRAVNLHLLFCPDENDHVERIERAISTFSFEHLQIPHRCDLRGLEDLGRAHLSDIQDRDAAISAGANQFKVPLVSFQNLFRNNKWVRDNCIVAVSASNNDGSAGLNADASFCETRRELERFANVIFSSNPKTRDFWLGKKVGYDVNVINTTFGGRKPCLHGCDAHKVEDVCKPENNRYCWIKGDPSFDSLRQALLEPEERVHIGETPPDRHDSSQCISRVNFRNTQWLTNGEVPLNPGLVAIIGARGSGKTALADMVAIGADVSSPRTVHSSFIYRACNPDNYLANAEVHLHWGDGAHSAKALGKENDARFATVRYLSQQFVDQLCSSEGLALELRREIERVVFASTEELERLYADDFEELANLHLNPVRSERSHAKEAIAAISDQVIAEQALHARVVECKSRETEPSQAASGRSSERG